MNNIRSIVRQLLKESETYDKKLIQNLLDGKYRDAEESDLDRWMSHRLVDVMIIVDGDNESVKIWNSSNYDSFDRVGVSMKVGKEMLGNDSGQVIDFNVFMYEVF